MTRGDLYSFAQREQTFNVERVELGKTYGILYKGNAEDLPMYSTDRAFGRFVPAKNVAQIKFPRSVLTLCVS